MEPLFTFDEWPNCLVNQWLVFQDYERSWRTKVEASVNYLASKLESLKDEGDPMPVALITYVLHLADHNMKDVRQYTYSTRQYICKYQGK